MQLLLSTSALLLASTAAASPLLLERASASIDCTNPLTNNAIVASSTPGEFFQIHCGTDYYGGDLSNTAAATFEACINTCAATTGCVDVSYIDNICYLKSSLTSPSANSLVNNAVLLGAQPQICYNNRQNNSLYISGLAIYQIECQTDLPGGDMPGGESNQLTFAACINVCSTTRGCVGAAYQGTTCYLKNQEVAGVSSSTVEAAILVI